MARLLLMAVGSWASCVNYQSPGYMSNKQIISGMPPANAKTYVTLPSGLTPCDLETLQNSCVNRINQYRSGALKFTDGTSDPGVPKPSINPYTQGNRCSNAIAFGDLYLNGGAGGCASAHANAFACLGSASGQNACCYRRGQTVAEIQSQLYGCLQQMWDEGEGLQDNAAFSQTNGHWYNMRSTSNTYVACGFAFTSDGGLWMNQDFYSGPTGPACSCPGAAGTSDSCGGVCYGAGGGSIACTNAYTQNGYTIGTSCGTNAASGSVCTAQCASQFAGTVSGSVTCSNGAYSGSFTGCVSYCPADAGWAATAPGTAATPKACTSPQVGSTTRMCSSTGLWQSPVVNCQTPATCTDGIQNQDETCIDCGGTACAACTPCACVNCGLHGNCTDGTCACSGGWTGPKCSIAPDPCFGITCQNGGACNGGACSCINGYSGTLCGTAPAATCTDGIKNQDESAIDCGGSCPACPTYQWIASDWSNCSVSCGGGNQQRSVQCADSKGVFVASANCSTLHPVELQQECNVDPCPTFTWITGAYGPCSSPCNSGVQTRSVQCQSSVGPTIVQSGCTAASKPDVQQTCNTDACTSYHWVSLPWTPCTASCAGGTQTRSIECRDVNDTLATNPTMCDATMTPPTQQSCNLQVCDSYKWQPCPTFLPCTAQCNGGGSMVGVQYRDVFCIRQSDQGVVDNSLCKDTPPTTALSVCNPEKCTGYNWMANANWGPCEQDSTGRYSRNRTFHCHDVDGQTALNSDCVAKAGKMPIDRLPCAPGVCSDSNGCPLVQIGTLFNYCSKIPDDCIPRSACAMAAAEVDDAFATLSTSAASAAACIATYNSGLPASNQISQLMLDAVKARLSTGQQVCELVLLSDASTPLCLAAAIVTLFVVLL